MLITPDKLLKGKPTVIKDKQYLSTLEYVEPFFEQMSKFTDNFSVNVQMADQMSLTNDQEDEIYNRVWIQAIMPEKYTIDSHDEVYGMIYGLDIRKPVYKVYRGVLNRACTNLCVFNPSWMQIQELKPEKNFVYSITSLMEKVSDIETKLRTLKNTQLLLEDKHHVLGKMIDKSILEEIINIGGKIKLSPSMVIKAFESVYHDTTSKYYVGENETSVFNYYNAFTELITHDKKDIIGKFEKILLTNSLFEI